MTATGPRPDSYSDVPLSALMQSARGTYAAAVRRAYIAAGCADLPPSGDFIISAMHWSDASLEAVIRWMGVSKQAVSQSVETLVVRGYLERTRDPADRRRVQLALTGRGRRAGRAARAAIERVDQGLAKRVGARSVTAAREVLVALLEMERGPPDARAGRA